MIKLNKVDNSVYDSWKNVLKLVKCSTYSYRDKTFWILAKNLIIDLSCNQVKNSIWLEIND